MTSNEREIRYVADPGAFALDLLGWIPDPKQMSILQSPARRVILNCSRQWGKTTVAATKVVHLVVTRPERTVLVVCENMSQTGEFFSKVTRFLNRLQISTSTEKGKAIGRRLPNGSRIIGIAAREAAVRGYTADFVFLDEAARIEDDVIDAFAPTVIAKQGDWWMASTPRGKRGRFWEAWTYAEGPDLLKVKAPAAENPRISQAFLERLRKEKGEAFVKQEFECDFVENGTSLVSLEEVDALFEP